MLENLLKDKICKKTFRLSLHSDNFYGLYFFEVAFQQGLQFLGLNGSHYKQV